MHILVSRPKKIGLLRKFDYIVKKMILLTSPRANSGLAQVGPMWDSNGLAQARANPMGPLWPTDGLAIWELINFGAHIDIVSMNTPGGG